MKHKKTSIAKLPNCNLPLSFSEKIIPKKQVAVRTEEEIDEYNKTIGYRKARMKRYGKSATGRLKEKNNKSTQFFNSQ